MTKKWCDALLILICLCIVDFFKVNIASESYVESIFVHPFLYLSIAAALNTSIFLNTFSQFELLHRLFHCCCEKMFTVLAIFS